MPWGYAAVAIGGALVSNAAGNKAESAGTRQSRNALRVAGELEERIDPFTRPGLETAPLLAGSVLTDTSLPERVDQVDRVGAQDVLSDPFFAALSADQDRRVDTAAAAGGRFGAGGTQDALIRQQLLLGQGFRQDEQAFRDNQRLDEQAFRQNDFTNRLTANQQRFGQLFQTTNLGQNATLDLGGQIVDLETDASAARNAGMVAAANQDVSTFDQLSSFAGGFTGGF